MFVGATLAVLIAMAMLLFRALAGPTVFDRVLAANGIGTLAILLVSLVGFLMGRPEFLDIAITYGLLNLIGTLAVLKYWRYGDLSLSGEEGQDG